MAKKRKIMEQLVPWGKVKDKLWGLFIAFIAMVVLLYVQQFFVPPPRKLATFPELALETKTPPSVVFRDGDIIFQQTAGDISEHIAAVTRSPLTHCGLIVIKEKDIYVLEAGNTVTLTPVEEWIQRGVNRKFALLRDETLTSKEQASIVAAGMKYAGKPYDFQYEWDDTKLYCSELVFKAFKQGSGKEPGTLVPLKSLKYQGHEDFIRQVMKEEVPLERMMLTPDSIYRYEKLKKIYDDFGL